MTMMTAEHIANEPQFGMTLRDYFAAKAMQSILVAFECGPDNVASVVASAYIVADAMMKARRE
jgi:hypothetical protein